MIEVTSLGCGYGAVDVLRDVNLRIPAGEMTGVLGPNGSGKTTLLHVLAGILPPREGRVRVSGRDLEGSSARWRARLMASVAQNAAVTFPFRCLSVVLMGRYPHLSRWGGYTEQDLEQAMGAMEQTGTLALADRLINEISGGEAQRVVIARALAQAPSVLLLDEATSSLDVARKIQVFDLLLEKNRGEGTTIVCAMHDLNLAALYCDRLIFIKDGGIALDGPTQELFTSQNLSEIYGTRVMVSQHPVTGSPQAHFVPGAALAGGPDSSRSGVDARGSR
ncbi:MAG: ABC transporter ATP-binding protein [Deltaproteobacteria bacterium]|nr:ABC transporter ATP-binding protein [Deltaproteobacteria bacterium]